MKCEDCGCEDVEEQWVNIPIMWGSDIGVIKSAPFPLYTCIMCGHIQGDPDYRSSASSMKTEVEK